MTDKSQSVQDVVSDAEKWRQIAIDKPLGSRAKEFFDKATTRLDPQIYKGDFQAYRSDADSKYESANETLNRMADKSDNLKSWFGNEKYQAEKSLPPHMRGYNFGRDTASGTANNKAAYSGSFEDVAKQYLMNEGRQLYSHLRGKGREFYEITRIGQADLGTAVAALASNGTEAALLGSKDFESKVSELAGMYGLSKERAITYVLSHELVHASQKGKYFDDHIRAELDVEHTLKEYFSEKGDHDLAAVASDRAAKVTSNYSSAGTSSAAMKNSVAKYFGKGSSAYSAPAGIGKGYAGRGAGSYNGKAAASAK